MRVALSPYGCLPSKIILFKSQLVWLTCPPRWCCPYWCDIWSFQHRQPLIPMIQQSPWKHKFMYPFIINTTICQKIREKSRKVCSRNSFAWKWSLRRSQSYSDGCFYEKYLKMHKRNITRPRMLICRVIKISDHTKCWSGESPHCWAAVFLFSNTYR
jgi:hypothetical protein